MSSQIIPKSLSKLESLHIAPATINISQLVDSAKKYSKFIKENNLLSLIDLITTKTVKYNFEKSNYQSLKKINIHSSDLKKCCGNQYKIYIEFLQKVSILAQRKPYNPDVKGETFGYGFTSEHSFKRLQFFLITNLKTVTEVIKFNNSYTEKYETIQCNLFHKTKFSIDFVNAERILFDKYLAMFSSFKNNKTKLYWRKYSAYHGALKQMVKLLNGKYDFTRTKKSTDRKPTGRFYTPLTYLNKVIRNMVFYDNQHLIQLDAKNMFPYLLAQYLPSISDMNDERIDRLKNCKYFNNKYRFQVFICNSSRAGISSSPNYFLCEDKNLKNFGLKALCDLSKEKCSTAFGKNITKGLIQNSSNIFIDVNAILYLYQNSITTNLVYSLKCEKSAKSQFYNTCTGISANLKSNSLTNFNRGELYKPIEQLYTENLCRESQKFSSYLQIGFNSYYISKKSLETLTDREIKEFNLLCVNGEIYKFLIEPFINDDIISWALLYGTVFKDVYKFNNEQDIALTKKRFISMLYAKNSMYRKEQKIFKTLFPILSDLVFERKKEGYKIITNELFETEASIIVDEIAKGLNKIKIKAFTIHDCIAVQEKHWQIAKSYMEQVFIKKFRSCPIIKIE